MHPSTEKFFVWLCVVQSSLENVFTSFLSSYWLCMLLVKCCSSAYKFLMFGSSSLLVGSFDDFRSTFREFRFFVLELCVKHVRSMVCVSQFILQVCVKTTTFRGGYMFFLQIPTFEIMMMMLWHWFEDNMQFLIAFVKFGRWWKLTFAPDTTSRNPFKSQSMIS